MNKKTKKEEGEKAAVSMVPIAEDKGIQASKKAKEEREARKVNEARQRKEAADEAKAARAEAKAAKDEERKTTKEEKARAKETARLERERLADERRALKAATRPCFCGCGTQVTGTFAMGHDGKVHGWYVRATREKKPEDLPVEASDEARAGLELWSKDRELTMKQIAALVRG